MFSGYQARPCEILMITAGVLPLGSWTVGIFPENLLEKIPGWSTIAFSNFTFSEISLSLSFWPTQCALWIKVMKIELYNVSGSEF